ncbi:Rpn family recombination-promoting nuclease/putative transposase [Gloeothece verrucosa]|uniref:Flagellar assembly protein H n=1 Tax=Gloeothece verrucosa (strain PCC 7822) TaxID=497965 RepID=E0UHN9_GLOV7|nr:Rpn family recombination-promoting nuclease/putative transposase [Gloeothece verrucosa]ADN13296.1 conserved hypothetical protein [Gloeothece verrucosa PCC 7822]
MYDNVCKFIAEEFSTELATWLLGEPILLTELSPKELSLEPIRSDSLILKQSSNIVLQVEFQTQPDPDIPFRMADYRLRVYRRYPQKAMRQVVIYLKKSNSELVYQNTFSADKLHHEFEVIRLWEQPTELFLNTPGLLSFAVLSQTEQKTEVLREVARIIDTLPQRRVRSNLSAATSILAGLVLNKEIIQQVLRRDIMQESVIYQEIVKEAREQGLQEGRQEGLQQAKQEIALNLLQSGMSVEQVVACSGLSEEFVQELLLGRLQGIKEVALNLLRDGISIEQVRRYTGLSQEIVQELQRSLQQ